MHKFGQLILRKIIKLLATRCQILRLKCTKSFVCWGSAPDPAGEAYNALHSRPPSWILGLLLREGRGREGTPCSPVIPPATTFQIKAWLGETDKHGVIVLYILLASLDKNATQNALKHAITNDKFNNFLGRGYSPLPRPYPQWEGRHPLPTLHPFGAGASLSALVALRPRRLWRLGLGAEARLPPVSKSWQLCWCSSKQLRIFFQMFQILSVLNNGHHTHHSPDSNPLDILKELVYEG